MNLDGLKVSGCSLVTPVSLHLGEAASSTDLTISLVLLKLLWGPPLGNLDTKKSLTHSENGHIVGVAT